MSKRLTQRHDAFFQRLLDQPENAAALLRERLPEEVACLLVDEPPEPIPGSFVSRRLRGYRTDRLFRTRTLTGRPVYLYCLLEHKSSPDVRTPLQLLGYQYQILDLWDRTEGKNPDGSWRPLPAILTMVVYHGVAEWTVPLSLAEATDCDPAMRPYLLDFRYRLVDLGRIPDVQLSQEQKLRVGFLILKHGTAGWTTRKQLVKLVREAMRLGHNDLATLIYYLLGDLEEPKSQLVREVLNDLLPEEEAQAMLSVAARQWLSEGEARGRTEGEARGRVAGKAEGKIDDLKRLLTRRFGALPDWAAQRIEGSSIEQLNAWLDDIFDADSVSGLLGIGQH
ncbi:MAG: Rpn family recombination-promoting nuclease/putative transposase [Pseudomonadota bacterium]